MATDDGVAFIRLAHFSDQGGSEMKLSQYAVGAFKSLAEDLKFNSSSTISQTQSSNLNHNQNRLIPSTVHLNFTDMLSFMRTLDADIPASVVSRLMQDMQSTWLREELKFARTNALQARQDRMYNMGVIEQKEMQTATKVYLNQQQSQRLHNDSSNSPNKKSKPTFTDKLIRTQNKAGLNEYSLANDIDQQSGIAYKETIHDRRIKDLQLNTDEYIYPGKVSYDQFGQAMKNWSRQYDINPSNSNTKLSVQSLSSTNMNLDVIRHVVSKSKGLSVGELTGSNDSPLSNLDPKQADAVTKAYDNRMNLLKTDLRNIGKGPNSNTNNVIPGLNNDALNFGAEEHSEEEEDEEEDVDDGTHLHKSKSIIKKPQKTEISQSVTMKQFIEPSLIIPYKMFKNLYNLHQNPKLNQNLVSIQQILYVLRKQFGLPADSRSLVRVILEQIAHNLDLTLAQRKNMHLIADQYVRRSSSQSRIKGMSFEERRYPIILDKTLFERLMRGISGTGIGSSKLFSGPGEAKGVF